jgi:hypothetical protein
VFDTEDISLRANIDYSLSRLQTLYLGLEARDGDVVSTAQPRLAYLDISDAVVQDDVFTDGTRYSYRARANTGILTLGYNFAFAERHALDVSYRGVYVRPKEEPPASVTTESIYYVKPAKLKFYMVLTSWLCAF